MSNKLGKFVTFMGVSSVVGLGAYAGHHFGLYNLVPMFEAAKINLGDFAKYSAFIAGATIVGKTGAAGVTSMFTLDQDNKVHATKLMATKADEQNELLQTIVEQNHRQEERAMIVDKAKMRSSFVDEDIKIGLTNHYESYGDVIEDSKQDLKDMSENVLDAVLDTGMDIVEHATATAVTQNSSSKDFTSAANSTADNFLTKSKIFCAFADKSIIHYFTN